MTLVRFLAFVEILGILTVCGYYTNAQLDITWNEIGGEIPLPKTTNECPELPPMPGSTPGTTGQKRYTKCWKTELGNSQCYLTKNTDCFDVLRENLLDPKKREAVCCPGACAWIYEHAWINGQGLVTKSRQQGFYEAVYSEGKQVAWNRVNTSGTETPRVTIASSIRGGIFPTLRAGCVVTAPSLLKDGQTTTNPLNIRPWPPTCPLLARPGSSPIEELSTPLCVQRLFAGTPSSVSTTLPSTPVTQSLFPFETPSVHPQTMCNVHCCEGDLCNGIGTRIGRNRDVFLTDTGGWNSATTLPAHHLTDKYLPMIVVQLCIFYHFIFA